MLNRENLHEYQEHSVKHIIDNHASALFLEMGLGKSVSTLTAIDELMFNRMEVEKVLVIAPKRVAQDTWTDEVNNWAHLKHLRVSVVLGSEKQRRAALLTSADIYTINRENVVWLITHYGAGFPFDMVVIDELSSFKSPQAQRFKALRRVRPMVKRVVGLTGTPAPNGLIDLWSQLYLLDMGERLGKTVTGYRSKYFNPGRRNGEVVFDYKLKEDSEREIQERIGDICISMKAEDYLDLPGRMHLIRNVHLSDEEMKAYLDFEKSQILALPEDEDVSVTSAAALRNKLVQFANGAVYNSQKEYHTVHNAKLEALVEMVEASTSPVLIFYKYKSDLERISLELKGYKPRMLDTSQDMIDWNAGKVKVLLAHPASAGHGLNLQKGGHTILWFGDPDSLELYQQANARLDRQGQTTLVMIHHLATVGTIDEDIAKALINKADVQEALMQAVKARITKYK